MVLNCDVPALSGIDEKTKLVRIEKYLYELDEQLKVVLQNLDVDNFTVQTQTEFQLTKEAKQKAEADVSNKIENLKQKIIKTAKIIDMDIQEVRNEMTGYINAISDQFGTYTADYFRETVESALGTTETFKKVEEINGKILVSDGYIKTGEIGTDDEGKTLYGIEIGDVVGDSGFKLRCINNQISFWERGVTVAYITGHELVIGRAKFLDYVYFGGFLLDVVDGMAFNWEGDE